VGSPEHDFAVEVNVGVDPAAFESYRLPFHVRIKVYSNPWYQERAACPPSIRQTIAPPTRAQRDLGLPLENSGSPLPRRSSVVDWLGSSLRTGPRARASWEALSPLRQVF
jgi:hypothetical protein